MRLHPTFRVQIQSRCEISLSNERIGGVGASSYDVVVHFTGDGITINVGPCNLSIADKRSAITIFGNSGVEAGCDRKVILGMSTGQHAGTDGVLISNFVTEDRDRDQ